MKKNKVESLIDKKKLPFTCDNKECSNKNFQSFPNKLDENFYVKSILSDLKLSKSEIIKKTPTVYCKKCKLIFHKNWFNESTAYSVFNSIYGQHHYGWKNYYNFIQEKKLVDHGKLYEYLKNYNIKTYGEFNCPFSGIFFSFLNKRFNYRDHHLSILKKNNSRQVAHQKIIKKSKVSIIQSLETNKNLYLIKDNSPYCWGDNCNSKSINCKSISEQLMNIKIMNLESLKKTNIKFDLFGIFMTLDHTNNFYDVLNTCINKSKFLLIHCHINKNITKQHAFVLTNEFFEFYANKYNLNILNITSLIKKNVEKKESYFILSKNNIIV